MVLVEYMDLYLLRVIPAKLYQKIHANLIRKYQVRFGLCSIIISCSSRIDIIFHLFSVIALFFKFVEDTQQSEVKSPTEQEPAKCAFMNWEKALNIICEGLWRFAL